MNHPVVHNGRPVRIEVGHPRQAVLEWESDDRAGGQSSGAIQDDIDRRVQALLTELVPALV